MNKDNLISKALQHQKMELSANFNNLLMDKIVVKSRKREKQTQVLSYVLVSIISALLVALATFLLKDKFADIHFKDYTHVFAFNLKGTIFSFSTLLAAIVLFLLFVDGYLRHLRHKYMSRNNE